MNRIWAQAGFQSTNKIFLPRSIKSKDYAETYVSTSHPAKAGQIDDEIVKNGRLWMETRLKVDCRRPLLSASTIPSGVRMRTDRRTISLLTKAFQNANLLLIQYNCHDHPIIAYSEVQGLIELRTG